MAQQRRNTYASSGDISLLGTEELLAVNITFKQGTRGWWEIRAFAQDGHQIGDQHDPIKVHQSSPVGLHIQGLRKSIVAEFRDYHDTQ